MLRVKAIQGEPTRFRVEGNSVQCGNCGRMFNTRLRTELGDGVGCPKCGAALRRRWHLCDIAAHDLAGECDCEFYQMTKLKEVRRMTKEERMSFDDRCHHLEAARTFALDVALHAHRKVNQVEREECAP